MSDRKRFALSSVDLNLLKVLFVLAQKGNMTQAGDFVGLSQPAMSHALKRLRALTGDKLFVRTATGFAMTSFCAEIYPTVKRIIEETEAVVLSRRQFDPARSRRTFRIGMNDYFSVVLIPRLIQRMQAQSEQFVVEVIHMPRTVQSNGRSFQSLVQGYLDDGTIDVAVMTADSFPARYRCSPLFNERRVCIMAANNPAAGGQLTMETFLQLGHVKVTSAPSRRGWIDERLDALGRERNVVAVVPHFSAAVAVVAQSDLIAIMPESVARLFEASHDLLLLDFPFGSEQQSTSMIWLAENELDPASLWLRRQITECFSTEDDGSTGGAASGRKDKIDDIQELLHGHR